MYRNMLEREQEKKLNKKTNSKDTWFRKGGAHSPGNLSWNIGRPCEKEVGKRKAATGDQE